MIEFVKGRKRQKVVAREVPNVITGEMVTEYYVEVVIAESVQQRG